VSIDGLEIGSHVTAGDLTLPAGSSLVTDAETIMVSIQASPTEADLAEPVEAVEPSSEPVAPAESAE